MENWTNLDKGREGVKNPGNFVDIICTWPPTENTDEGGKGCLNFVTFADLRT